MTSTVGVLDDEIRIIQVEFLLSIGGIVGRSRTIGELKEYLRVLFRSTRTLVTIREENSVIVCQSSLQPVVLIVSDVRISSSRLEISILIPSLSVWSVQSNIGNVNNPKTTITSRSLSLEQGRRASREETLRCSESNLTNIMFLRFPEIKRESLILQFLNLCDFLQERTFTNTQSKTSLQFFSPRIRIRHTGLSTGSHITFNYINLFKFVFSDLNSILHRSSVLNMNRSTNSICITSTSSCGGCVPGIVSRCIENSLGFAGVSVE